MRVLRDGEWHELSPEAAAKFRDHELRKKKERDELSELHKREGIAQANAKAEKLAQRKARIETTKLADKFWIDVDIGASHIRVNVANHAEGLTSWDYQGSRECKPWYRVMRHIDELKGQIAAQRAINVVLQRSSGESHLVSKRGRFAND